MSACTCRRSSSDKTSQLSERTSQLEQALAAQLFGSFGGPEGIEYQQSAESPVEAADVAAPPAEVETSDEEHEAAATDGAVAPSSTSTAPNTLASEHVEVDRVGSAENFSSEDDDTIYMNGGKL